MRISNKRTKVLFLKRDYNFKNGMNETVPAWVPYNPFKPSISHSPPILSVVESSEKPIYGVGYAYPDTAPYQVWAKVIAKSAKETNEGEFLSGLVTYDIYTRYIRDATSELKLMIGDKVMDIVSALDVDFMHKETKITCVERVF